MHSALQEVLWWAISSESCRLDGRGNGSLRAVSCWENVLNDIRRGHFLWRGEEQGAGRHDGVSTWHLKQQAEDTRQSSQNSPLITPSHLQTRSEEISAGSDLHHTTTKEKMHVFINVGYLFNPLQINAQASCSTIGKQTIKEINTLY